MSLPDKFQQHLQSKRFFEIGDKIILACSGGIDSVVLAHLLSVTGTRFELAHMNFHLRGTESDRDQQFIESLAAEFSVRLHLKHTDAYQYASTHGVSVQVAARELRYAWFSELVDSHPIKRRFVVTAHHSDDNIETVLMNFFRGTGIRGLTGIPEVNQYIIRPLLPFSRKEIHDYAISQQINWVEDSSNQSSTYTRNQVRLDLLPVAEQIFPDLRINLQHNIQRFGEINELYQYAVEKLKKRLLNKHQDEWRIPVAALLNTKPLRSMVFECFQDFGFDASQADELIHLCHVPTGKWMSSASHRVVRHQKWLLIDEIKPGYEPVTTLIAEDINELQVRHGSIHLSVHQNIHNIKKSAAFGQLDRSKLIFPLIVRPWKAGDYFYPFGMEKKKKVARFLIDLKLPLPAKEKVLVVEMDKRIIWVVGYRPDNRFRVTESTKDVFMMEFRPVN